jgi:ElaB/YqjD/DUF883 family membrane-anchored ribosome-binding protein
MKNIQKQYTDLLEGKMSKSNFMRNVRMQFPQYVSPVTSYDDSVKILKGKRIISEAAKPEGVYGHNPNAETPPAPGIDQLNYYQVYHGIQYELALMPEITDEAYVKARKKVVDTILKDPDAYKQLQLANFKAVKAMDEDLKMKEVKEGNLVDKPNEMRVVKKDAKGNTEDSLGKKERRKAKNGKGITQMTQTPKKAKGIAKVMEVPGKEKVMALREHIMQEMTKLNLENEHFNVGARVKKKDNSLVGEITEWDGDTATVKTDEGEVHHIQGNILTKKDVPAPKEEAAKTNTPDEWAKPKAHLPEDQQKPVDEAKPNDPHSIKADQAIDQSELKFLKNAFAKTPADQIPEKYKKIIADLEAKLGTVNEDREEKMKNLKEKLMKTVRETRALIVPKTATGTQVDQIVQQKMPAAKAGDTVDIIRK